VDGDGTLSTLRRGWPGGRAAAAVRGGVPRAHAALVALFLAPLLALAANLARGEEGHPYFELSAGFKTGDFGTPTRSDLYPRRDAQREADPLRRFAREKVPCAY